VIDQSLEIQRQQQKQRVNVFFYDLTHYLAHQRMLHTVHNTYKKGNMSKLMQNIISTAELSVQAVLLLLLLLNQLVTCRLSIFTSSTRGARQVVKHVSTLFSIDRTQQDL